MITADKDFGELIFKQECIMNNSHDDFELQPEYDFSKGIRGRFYTPKKVSTTIRLDNDIILYFKKLAGLKNRLPNFIKQSFKRIYSKTCYLNLTANIVLYRYSRYNIKIRKSISICNWKNIKNMIYYEYMVRNSLVIVIFISIIFFSCSDESYFGEYEGVNLISGHTFSEWTADQIAPYMNYASTVLVSPPSAYPSNEVHILEIANLMPNGDFGSGLVTPWVDGGTALTFEISAGNEIDGNTMHFIANDLTDRVEINIRTNATDGFNVDASYLIRFDYRTVSGITFEYNDGASSLSTGKSGGGVDGGTISPSFSNLNSFPNVNLLSDFPDISVGAAANYFYSFGSYTGVQQQTQEAYIDNVKLIRTDIDQKIRIVLAAQGDTVEPLISGYYRFSVYIYNDISLIAQPNRFAANGVTLSVVSGIYNVLTSTLTTSDYSTSESFTDGTDGDWSNWTEVHTDLYIQFDPEDGVELVICPMDILQDMNMNSGALIISSPRFILFPDGF